MQSVLSQMKLGLSVIGPHGSHRKQGRGVHPWAGLTERVSGQHERPVPGGVQRGPGGAGVAVLLPFAPWPGTSGCLEKCPRTASLKRGPWSPGVISDSFFDLYEREPVLCISRGAISC